MFVSHQVKGKPLSMARCLYSSSSMSKLQQLRLFVGNRLTAAAEEIFGAVERTIFELQNEANAWKDAELAALQPEEVEVEAAAAADSQAGTVYEGAASAQLLLMHLTPESERNEEQWSHQDKGTSQDPSEAEAVAGLKSEQGPDSSSACSHGQTDEEIIFAQTSTEGRNYEEKADGYNGSNFCQPISSDSGTEPDVSDTEEMESRASNSSTTAGRSKTRLKQRLTSSSLDIEKMTKPFCCKTCGASFLRRSSLVIHAESHAKNMPILCPSNYTSPALESLQTHKEDNLCHICGKTFTTWTHLRRHMLIHTGQRPYCCKECGKTFARGECLTVHMRIHTVERPYTCEVCGKGFRQRSNLITHMRKHTGEKPYRCDICSRPFAYKKDMMRHVQIHTKT